MKLTKVTTGINAHVIAESNHDKFMIAWFGSDIYWVMLDYSPNNKFIVTKDSPELWNFLTKLFKTNRFKNCTFLWNSKAGIEKKDNKLKITKGTQHFKIRFIQSPTDTLAKYQGICPICFCLSGSNQQEIANEFSNFLHELLNRD